jgi:hypothetical protein
MALERNSLLSEHRMASDWVGQRLPMRASGKRKKETDAVSHHIGDKISSQQ